MRLHSYIRALSVCKGLSVPNKFLSSEILELELAQIPRFCPSIRCLHLIRREIITWSELMDLDLDILTHRPGVIHQWPTQSDDTECNMDPAWSVSIAALKEWRALKASTSVPICILIVCSNLGIRVSHEIGPLQWLMYQTLVVMVTVINNG